MIGFDANSHVYHKEHNGRRNFINRGKEMTAHTKSQTALEGSNEKSHPLGSYNLSVSKEELFYPKYQMPSSVKIYYFKQFYSSLVWNELPVKISNG